MMDPINVEMAFATPDRQFLKALTVDAGATVEEIIELSGVGRAFPDLCLDALVVGIWGKPVERSAIVQRGDRVEIYRSLHIDPRVARRQIAEAGGTMGLTEKGLTDNER